MEMNIISWIAASLVFTSFFMKTIVRLRFFAVLSNIAFIGYASIGIHYNIFDKVAAIFILHIALLPLNIVRLIQMKRAVKAVHTIGGEQKSLACLTPYMAHETVRRGHVLFKRGDHADCLYLLRRGVVDLVDVQREVGVGEIFGEVAIFLENGVRTSTAICREDCDLFSIKDTKVMELVYQEPGLALFFLRALSGYLSRDANSRAIRAPATADG